jgi:hypothetical protein
MLMQDSERFAPAVPRKFESRNFSLLWSWRETKRNFVASSVALLKLFT